MNETQCAAAPLDPKDQRIKDLEHEVDMLTNAGVIECAVRNKSVSEYMEHWEGRATKAEQALALRGEPVAWMYSDSEGNDAFGNNYAALTAMWCHYKGDPMVPLYAAPISGERVANEKRKGERRIDYSKAGMLNRDCKDRRRYVAPAVSGERVREAYRKVGHFSIDEDSMEFIQTGPIADGQDVFVCALPLAAQPEGK